MTQSVQHPEMARPYFERQMTFGRRVIFQWNEVRRFGDICPDCHQKAEADGTIIEGFTFVDERRAALFDLEFLQAFDVNDDEEPLTTFRSWDEAQNWLMRA